MKKYIESQKMFIDYYLVPKNSTDKVKDGEIIEHIVKIKNILFYHKIEENGVTKYLEIELSEQFIEDVRDEIQKMKDVILLLPYESLPF